MNQKKLSRKINLRYCAIQYMSCSSMFIIFCFVTVILQSKGFNIAQIGITVSLGATVSIFLPPLIAKFYARHNTMPLKRIVAFAMSLTVIFAVLLIFINNPLLLVMGIFILIVGTVMSSSALLNALAMQFEHTKVLVNYGLGRATGSIGSATMGLVVGALMDKLGLVAVLIFFAMLISAAIALVLSFMKPESIGGGVKSTEFSTIAAAAPKAGILKNPAGILFFITMVLIISNQATLDSYQVYIIKSLGGTYMDYGTAMTVMGACEIPLMMAFKFLTRRFSYAQLITAGFFFALLKNVGLLLASSVGAVIMMQTFNLVSLSLFIPGSVYFGNSLVDSKHVVVAQALFSGTAMAVGRIVGNMLGGFVIDNAGIHAMLFVCMAYVVLAIVLMQAANRLNKRSKASFSAAGEISA